MARPSTTDRLRRASPFRADLPHSVRTLQAGALLNAVGNGLVLPFLFLYLHDVRDVSATTTGLIVGTAGAVGLVATPLSGVVIDRVGGRPTLAASLVLMSAGNVGYALSERPSQALAAALLAGLGNASFWPAQSTMLVALTQPRERPAAFAMQRVMMNLGVGIGGMVGGLVARTDTPLTFQALFQGNALTFVLYAAILTRVPHVPPARDGEAGEGAGRYADVLRHGAFMSVILLNLLLIAAGIAMLEVLPAWAKAEGGVSERGIGLIFLVNTLVIVATQMRVVRADWKALGISGPAAVRDLWGRRNLGVREGDFRALLAPHACRLIKITPVRENR